MKKLLEEYSLELLLLVITVVEITRWWVPEDLGAQHLYAVSHWVLSYDHGFVRRGLVGEILRMWAPMVTIENVVHASLVVYYSFITLLVVALIALVRHRDEGGRLFRLVLLFLVNPATVSLVARDLGLFDIFLTIATFLAMTLLTINRQIWLIPVFLTVAMFIHEGFLILYAPTVLASMLFLYVYGERKKSILATFVVSTLAVTVSFFILYKYGIPTLGYKELASALQSRADFSVTPLSVRECYFGILDHYRFATSSLYDAGSLSNLVLALIVLSPTAIILLDVWTHVPGNRGKSRWAVALLFLATLSGLMIVAIATDYGRWLSAVVFCNFFTVFFLIGRGIVKVETLFDYEAKSFQPLFVIIILAYVFFGPFHDWNPYPYRDDVVLSSIFIAATLLFDVGFIVQRRRRERGMAARKE